MFAIIRTLQFLELAHSRQNIKQADYEQECNMLLSNFKTARIQNGGDSFSVDDFVQTCVRVCLRVRAQGMRPNKPTRA